jgi:hypothetical protein
MRARHGITGWPRASSAGDGTTSNGAGGRRDGERTATPALMEELARAQARIVRQLGEVDPRRAAIAPDEARSRLQTLFWAERKAEEADHRHERHVQARARTWRRDRQRATAGWLWLTRRASRTMLVVVAAAIAAVVVVSLALAGHLQLPDLLRLLPHAAAP